MSIEKCPSREEAQRFRGLARVHLKTLDFQYALSTGHRDVSDRIVHRLLDVFRLEGCKRSEVRNFVKAKVDQEELDAALASQELDLPQKPPEDWEAIPILALPSLDCLNGLHRVLAARQHLDGNDQWWVAKLYTSGRPFLTLPPVAEIVDILADLPRASCKNVAEEYSNEQAYSDGEIFRKIRQSHNESDDDGEQKWWARLTGDKPKDLRTILKDKRFERAFDAMLPWPGLWTSISLCSLRKRMGKCDEVSESKANVQIITNEGTGIVKLSLLDHRHMVQYPCRYQRKLSSGSSRRCHGPKAGDLMSAVIRP